MNVEYNLPRYEGRSPPNTTNEPVTEVTCTQVMPAEMVISGIGSHEEMENKIMMGITISGMFTRMFRKTPRERAHTQVTVMRVRLRRATTNDW